MNENDSLERSLVLAGLDALRQNGGDDVVRQILGHAAFGPAEDLGSTGRIAIVDYLRYRDAAVAVLGERFRTISFETGRTLVKNLRHRKVEEIRQLLERLSGNHQTLFQIGQAALLAAKGSPGVVRASFPRDNVLCITIEDCPECRGLKRDSPFCFLNQGLITEFAAAYLKVRVRTEETACMALGDPFCRTEVSVLE
jgi:predicted hydrocarbon binding protein